MTAYYNEIDPYAAEQLEYLIAQRRIAPGVVDRRDIRDVQAGDLIGYVQCHFFAGVGGFSRALRLAGWPDDRPVWTGSCPCQPFSTAGKLKGFEDDRHLWPVWFNLIRERRPTGIFGEQVANAPAWLALVRRDLGQVDYAMAGVPIEAASAGAEHARLRYLFVAHPANDDDRRAYGPAGARQAPEPRSRLCARDDRGREIRVLGRVLPDPAIPLLAYEIPNRLARYRAIGNAIDPELVAEFIAAYRECQP